MYIQDEELEFCLNSIGADIAGCWMPWQGMSSLPVVFVPVPLLLMQCYVALGMSVENNSYCIVEKEKI